MKRWLIIILVIITSIIFIIDGTNAGCAAETQHNGSTLCFACIGI